MAWRWVYVGFENRYPDLKKSAPERAVFISLADHSDKNGYCYPGIARIAFRTGFGERRISSALDFLCEYGYLERKGARGRKGSMRYQLSNHERIVIPPKLLEVFRDSDSSRSSSLEDDLNDTAWAEGVVI